VCVCACARACARASVRACVMFVLASGRKFTRICGMMVMMMVIIMVIMAYATHRALKPVPTLPR